MTESCTSRFRQFSVSQPSEKFLLTIFFSILNGQLNETAFSLAVRGLVSPLVRGSIEGKVLLL
jgi:hypothetical protein